MSIRIHCEVLEAPTHEWMPRGGQAHRELLPWADPYIAELMRRLEERFDEGSLAPPDRETREESDRSARYRRPVPVYGGWPLLEDR